jgi:hypothetical protein
VEKSLHLICAIWRCPSPKLSAARFWRRPPLTNCVPPLASAVPKNYAAPHLKLLNPNLENPCVRSDIVGPQKEMNNASSDVNVKTRFDLLPDCAPHPLFARLCTLPPFCQIVYPKDRRRDSSALHQTRFDFLPDCAPHPLFARLCTLKTDAVTPAPCITIVYPKDRRCDSGALQHARAPSVPRKRGPRSEERPFKRVSSHLFEVRPFKRVYSHLLEVRPFKRASSRLLEVRPFKRASPRNLLSGLPS